MKIFDYGSSELLTFSHGPELRKALAVSDFPSCEYAPANLLIWSGAYGTRIFNFEGRTWLHLASIDELLFPCGGAGLPSAEELRAVSDGMRNAGFSGKIFHVPVNYPEAVPVSPGFRSEPMDDGNDEYIYRTETLAELPGSRLSKKRNLIHQFERNCPDFTLRPITSAEDLQSIRTLSEEWDREHTEDEGIRIEKIAFETALTHFEEAGLEGLMLLTPEGLKAFAVFSPVNFESFTIHFEKTEAECKGASQVITNRTAIALQGRCKFINREQDLGVPGLRKAKQSYQPDRMLKELVLIPAD